MLYTYIQHYMAKATSEIPSEIHEMKYSHFRRIYILLFISRSIYLRLYLPISVQFRSILFGPGREVLSLSVYLLPPLQAWDLGEWRNILRTKCKKGVLGMYLLFHPSPHVQGYISWRLRLCDSPPYPSTTWTSLRRPVLSPSLYLSIYISLSPRRA
jgi:hypothetical protein